LVNDFADSLSVGAVAVLVVFPESHPRIKIRLTRENNQAIFGLNTVIKCPDGLEGDLLIGKTTL